ncbi:unnamed protein product [Sphagnum tenellum]
MQQDQHQPGQNHSYINQAALHQKVSRVPILQGGTTLILALQCLGFTVILSIFVLTHLHFYMTEREARERNSVVNTDKDNIKPTEAFIEMMKPPDPPGEEQDEVSAGPRTSTPNKHNINMDDGRASPEVARPPLPMPILGSIPRRPQSPEPTTAQVDGSQDQDAATQMEESSQALLDGDEEEQRKTVPQDKSPKPMELARQEPHPKPPDEKDTRSPRKGESFTWNGEPAPPDEDHRRTSPRRVQPTLLQQAGYERRKMQHPGSGRPTIFVNEFYGTALYDDSKDPFFFHSWPQDEIVWDPNPFTGNFDLLAGAKVTLAVNFATKKGDKFEVWITTADDETNPISPKAGRPYNRPGPPNACVPYAEFFDLLPDATMSKSKAQDRANLRKHVVTAISSPNYLDFQKDLRPPTYARFGGPAWCPPYPRKIATTPAFYTVRQEAIRSYMDTVTAELIDLEASQIYNLTRMAQKRMGELEKDGAHFKMVRMNN